jgi:hypothetical protein
MEDHTSAERQHISRVDLGGGRGLGRYGDPIHDTYYDMTGELHGTIITVQDSSAAMYDAAWLRLEGTVHLTGPAQPFAGISGGIAPGRVSAHLNIEKAKQIRDALDAWIARVEGVSDHPEPGYQLPGGGVEE